MLTPEQIQSLGNLPSALRQKLPLAPGDDIQGASWKNLKNLRLRVRGNNVFWTTRGGSTLVNSFSGNILTVEPVDISLSGSLKQYLVVHTAAGKVYLWDLGTDTSTEIVTSGFSTTQKIQIYNIGRFIYMHDYGQGKESYYDLKGSTLYDYLSYNKSYIHTQSWLADGLVADEPNIWGFQKGELILVFPNRLFSASTEIFDSTGISSGATSSFNPSTYNENSFYYTYNGGKYLKDSDGKGYKQSQFITVPTGTEQFGFTVEGTGSEFTINRFYIPLDKAGDPSFLSYTATIEGINNNIISWKDPAGVEQSTVFGGYDSGDENTETLVLPYTSDLEELVGLPVKHKLSTDGTAVEVNSQYTEPTIYRQYVILEVLRDGSVTQLGLPYQLSAGPSEILINGYTRVSLTATTPDSAVADRILAATRWQASAGRAFDPSNEFYANSPLFIIGPFKDSVTIIRDTTPDRSLIRPVTELHPMRAGVSDLFGSGQISTRTVAKFRGSLMHAGYVINRPVPDVYTDPSVETTGNTYVNITATTTIAKNMALAFLYLYTDGTFSNIVETEHFLQENQTTDTPVSVGCDQVKGTASQTVTAGCSSDGNIEITYNGRTVTVALTTASHAAAADTAEAIRAAIQADTEIQISASITATPQIDYQEERFGEEFNGNSIVFSDAGTTGVTLDNASVNISGASEPTGTAAKLYVWLDSNALASGTHDSSLTVGAVTSSAWTVSPGESETSIHSKIVGAVNGTGALASDWTATTEIVEIDGVSRTVVVLTADEVGDESFNDIESRITLGTVTLDVVYGLSAPGRFSVLYGPVDTNGAAAVCQSAQGFIDVSANAIGAGLTEDHTITVDGDTTPAITISDTDTTEQIVDKYITAIQTDESIDRLWRVSKEDRGAGTWRLIIEHRQRGASFNGLVISIAGDVGVTVAVTSPTAGGTDAGTVPSGTLTTIEANKVQIHSLNGLVEKVFILGRSAPATFHPIKEIGITDPGAHGQEIVLPGTAAELTEIEADSFTAPVASQILETAGLFNYVNVGTPAQQFQIFSQQAIRNEYEILRAIPLVFDVDRATMRFRVMIFTTDDIEIGYLVDSTTASGRIFQGDFEVLAEGMATSAPKSIRRVRGIVYFESDDGPYAFDGQSAPQLMFDKRRYAVSENNSVQDFILNIEHNELWILYASSEIVIYDFDSGKTRRMDYAGAIGGISAATYYLGNMYIAGLTDLLLTDQEDVYLDVAETISASAETDYIGDELTQTRLLDLTVGGQALSCAVALDYQDERFIDIGTGWQDDFEADQSIAAKQLNMAGQVYSLYRYGIMPRLRLTWNAVAGGFLSHVILKYYPTRNDGQSRE